MENLYGFYIRKRGILSRQNDLFKKFVRDKEKSCIFAASNTGV